MLYRVSNALVNWLTGKNNIDDEKREVYLYGAMLFLSTAAGLLSMFIISILLFDFLTYLVFLIFFIPLRLTAGGYHCSKYSSCFIVSNILFLGIVLLAKITYHFVLFQTISSIITLGIVAIFSPVTNPSNPLSKKRKLINRKKSIIIMVIQCVVINFFNVIQNDLICYYGCVAAYCGLSIAILMIIELINERRKKNA